jgi:hypothetical protein
MKIAQTAKALAAVTLFSAGAFAGTVTYSIGGTFPNTAPVSTYSAPNATWSMTFQITNPPVVFSSTAVSFNTTYTNANYTLNGVNIPVTGSVISFAVATLIFSGFSLFLDSGQNFTLVSEGVNPALYSGGNLTPTLLTGTFSYPQVDLQIVSPASSTLSNTTGNLVVTAVAPPGTPAPTSVLLVSTGLAALALIELLRRKQAAA